jgi:hypothetical protein
MNRGPRLTLARQGLAARALEGVVASAAYGDTTPMRVIAPMAAVLRAPQAEAEVDDQLVFGELFDVLIHEGMFALGQARRDGYVGYVDRAALAPEGPAPTHRVSALRAYAFAAPDFKAASTGPFSMNVLVRVVADEGRYRQVEGCGWFAAEQLAPIGAVETEPAAVAERFAGTPYLWGGRTSLGLDCSGLVQQALYACGRACPRDSDLQQVFFPAIAREEAGRGDLVFWPDHVGMLLDQTRVIHANARTMDVAIEPIDSVSALRAADGPPSFARV